MVVSSQTTEDAPERKASPRPAVRRKTARTSSTNDRGRPRSAEVDRTVLDAVLKRLFRQGYARLSVSAVAEEVGVGKPTIYLRWPSKAALAAAALSTIPYKVPLKTRLTGNTRADLLAFLREVSGNFSRHGIGMTGAFLSEEQDHPELMEMYREHVAQPTRELFRAILRGAVERGEINPGMNLDAAVHMLIGSMYAASVSGEQSTVDVESIADIVLDGLRKKP